LGITMKEQAMTTEHADLLTLDAKVKDFLAQRRIAIAGISATRQTPANMIYRKLKAAGYQVFAISPTAETFDDDRCYADLSAIPGDVDGAVIATRPAATEELVRQCVATGIPRVWMHESLIHGGTSVSAAAVVLCREHGITLIAGACPMMYCAPVDVGHRCMRWMMGITGGLPK
jgi:predicted CoA-binding protein